MALLGNTGMDLDAKIPLWHKPDVEKDSAPNKIRELREARKWSQQQLADALNPSTTQPQIDRLEKGERKLTQDWMTKIAAALKIDPQELLPSLKSRGENKPVDNPQGVVESKPSGAVTYLQGAQTLQPWPKDLKIIGHVKAGVDGFFLDQGEHHGMAYRPPALASVKDAFAVYVQDDSMSPKFEPGEILWVHPTRPVAPGNNVIIEMHDGQAFVKRLVRRTVSKVICTQWQPEKKVEYDAKKVKHIYFIVGSYRED